MHERYALAERVDLLVVHPGAARNIYGPLAEDFVAVEPPLWSRLIAGYAMDQDFSVRIIDAEAEGKSPASVAADAFLYRPHLVCIVASGHQPSASTQQMSAAIETARQIKSVCVAPIIVVGGHVAALPERTLRDTRAFDYACSGEGPLTVAALLRGEEKSKVGDLVWRNGDCVVVNAASPLIEDLSQLRGDIWHKLPMRKYRAHNWQAFGNLSKRQPYASIYTTLGCPYKCSFCGINAPFRSNRYRMRPPIDVVAEVRTLHDRYGVSTFKVVDEMFVLNERHYGAICEGLAALPFAEDLNIWAYARVDTVKPDKLALLRRAGVQWLALGIESASAYVRDGAQKRLKRDDIKDVVRTIQAAGINVIGNYIFGLPDDDAESMRATLDMALDINTEFANFYSAMAYPGSPLYVEAMAKSWTLPDSWSGYSQHSEDCRPMDTRHVGAAEVLRFRDEAFQAYFTSPRYLDIVGQKFGHETVEHVQKMTEYRLPRRLLRKELVLEAAQ